MPPLQHPDYEVVRELGRGGMGVVYLARNRLLDRPEVLKVVNRALLERPGVEERFLREMQAAARLNHPNIVAAYSALRLGDLLVFAMEYVEGEDLAQAVADRGPLPIPHACHCIYQAALGLQHAHEKGMVHRDNKPSNLIVARDGKKLVAKILDFGLAKATSEQRPDSGLTGAGKMLGTPDYIAPEQTLDAARTDVRADIYSLGCTLYSVLSGAPPFRGNSLYELLHAHQSAEATPLDALRPEVPTGLIDGILTGTGPGPVSHLYTARGDYRDFELRVEVRLNSGGNSGIYCRCPFGPRWPATVPRWLLGYNVKLDTQRQGGICLSDLDGEGPLVNGAVTADYTDDTGRFRSGHIAFC